MYILFRAAVSSVLSRRTIDVFPLASAFVFARSPASRYIGDLRPVKSTDGRIGTQTSYTGR
eukprot:8677483-Heterocapsa_arctica.AAC.1